MSKVLSPSLFSSDSNKFFNPNCIFDTNIKIRFPKSFRVMEGHSMNAVNGIEVSNQKMQMNASDEILVADRKMLPRVMTLETHNYAAAGDLSPPRLISSFVRGKSTIALFIAFALQFTSGVAAKDNKIPVAKTISAVPTQALKLGHAAPDFLNDYHLVIAWYPSNSSDHRQANVSINVIESNHTLRKCEIPYKNPVGQIRRLNFKSVIVTLSSNTTDTHGHKQETLLVVNTNNCKSVFVTDRYLPPPSNVQIFLSDNVNDDKFFTVVQGKEYCEGHVWCRMFFDPFFCRVEPLKFEFPDGSHHTKIEPVKSNITRLLGVNFVDGQGTFIARLYGFSNLSKSGLVYKQLLSLPKYSSMGLHGDDYYYAMAASSMSFCWRSKNETIISCSRFETNGALMFNRSIDYADSVDLLKVVTITNGFVLFSQKYNCNENNLDKCSFLHVAVVRESQCSIVNNISPSLEEKLLDRWSFDTVKRRKYYIKCDRTRHVTFVVRENQQDGSLEVQYLCKLHETFVHGIFYVD